jgi:hypothetical protein
VVVVVQGDRKLSKSAGTRAQVNLAPQQNQNNMSKKITTVRYKLCICTSCESNVCLVKAKKIAKKNGSFSLIERVILSAGAMLIFSVSFQIDQMSEDEMVDSSMVYIVHMTLCCVVVISLTVWQSVSVELVRAYRSAGPSKN